MLTGIITKEKAPKEK